ncbi:MAG: MarR family transcriptional regulator [Blautia sp.]|nr:MarR family transcriptional regulator [Blautia sp.]
MTSDPSYSTSAAPDPLSLDSQLCFPLYAAARKVVALYTPYFKPLGLTYTQYIALMALWQEHTISVKDLGQKLCLDSGTLTPLLKKMEAAGYVTRKRSQEDERLVMITITGQGMSLKERVADIPAKIGSCIPLETDEAIQLYTLLYKLLANI